ncbi:ABC transporter permease subunit [Streptomyces sp. TRM43335]|uniref:ABC transporter permease subunit n=1 Tax=Streptomyces taklimakanensis TaxID=2569853 RepID=A0A6G2BH63_9ACTN|nr:ABC transporter permease [Streptomyces taklimakanensis]MTE21403.1 ABC transporter permease subunit [Streptomyces taklimakanensis]
MWSSVRAMVGKDLTVSRRNPTFVIITVLVPLVFVSLYALLTTVSTTQPVAVAKEGDGPHSERMMRVLETMRNADGELFEIRTTDPRTAREMFADGEVGAVLTIPAEFDRRVEDGEPVALPLKVFNINADATKNFQLRTEHAVRVFSQQRSADVALTEVEEDSHFSEDMKTTVYLGTSLIMFAVLYASMVNAGTLVAREWEERTAKPLVLTPTGTTPLLLGKWIGAGSQTVVSTLLALLGLYLLLDYPVLSLGPVSWLSLLLLFCYGSALGSLLGAVLRRSLPLVPLCVVVAITHFLLNGYESYMRGFAHGGLVEWTWAATHWWPVSGITQQIRQDVTGLGGPGVDWAALGWTAVAAAVLTLLATARMRRQFRFTQGQ